MSLLRSGMRKWEGYVFGVGIEIWGLRFLSVSADFSISDFPFGVFDSRFFFQFSIFDIFSSAWRTASWSMGLRR